ncbi:DHS-like NAD/FAD-binding domain-containing protein [Tuber magnatum]|uniref:DHS-like NAD/FAD-binding domain-containing protein n=1 Tax=Tuber magnatum TaxID=42249 RepID=A0A317SXW4_9PEZI|nr:DHS-like NAD/FAD-binding domain-containing protein [Tuber magnatum]
MLGLRAMNDITPAHGTHPTLKCEALFAKTNVIPPRARHPAGTGLYSNHQTLNLPHPETVFDMNLCRTNPQPSYTLAKSLNPGQFTQTITHAFISPTAKKDLLQKCFTQNIDTLERAAGVPPEKLVEAHGSCETCTGLVKPNIVFFGESLPSEFHMGLRMVEEADLVIIMGSSLSVYPFAALPGRAREGAVRVLMNNERAGGLELGWTEELEEVWRSVGGGTDKEAEAEAESSESAEPVESMNAKVGRLTEEVERSLSVVDGWKENVVRDLSTQETRIARTVEADLRGENGEVSLVDQKKLGGATADQLTGSSED